MRNLAFVQERKPKKVILVCIRRLLSLSYYRAISSHRILSFKPSGTELMAFEAFPLLRLFGNVKGQVDQRSLQTTAECQGEISIPKQPLSAP